MSPEMREKMEAAMSDPKMQEQMQAYASMMQQPEVQDQMRQMQSAMSDKGLQEKLAALQDDEELGPMFKELKTQGMGALMKYWNDPEMLNKLAAKLGPENMAAMGGGAPGGAAPAPPPPAADPTNLLEAAKAGDLEAVEDFIAVGKDVNEQDAAGRSAMHYAVAMGHGDILEELLAAGAQTEVRDAKDNTPLHYAAGYGKAEITTRLLEAGANPAVQNETGKTPPDLVRMEPKNPLNQEAALMDRMEEAAAAAAFQDS